MAATRKKTTIYIDADLMRSVKLLAASSDRQDYEVIEDALSQYVEAAQHDERQRALLEFLEELDDPTDLDDDEALELAYAELHAMRRERRRG